MTIARVISEGLNLRDGAGAHFPLVTSLARGDRVELLGEIAASGWAFVQVVSVANGNPWQVGMRGFLDTRFVEIEALPPPDVEPESCPMPETEPLLTPRAKGVLVVLGAVLLLVAALSFL